MDFIESVFLMLLTNVKIKWDKKGIFLVSFLEKNWICTAFFLFMKNELNFVYFVNSLLTFEKYVIFLLRFIHNLGTSWPILTVLSKFYFFHFFYNVMIFFIYIQYYPSIYPSLLLVYQQVSVRKNIYGYLCFSCIYMG